MEIYIFIGLALVILYIILKYNYNINQEKNIKTNWGKFPKFDEDDRFDEKKIYSGFKTIAECYDKKNLLDEITWNDLDMFRIFKQISISASSLGEESLYFRLRNIDVDDSQAEKIEQVISFLDSNQKKRIRIQKYFIRLGKLKDRSIFEFIKDLKSDSKYLFLHLIMGLMPIFSYILIRFNLSMIGTILLVFSLSQNLIYFESKKLNFSKEFELISYLTSIMKTGRKVSRLGIPYMEKLNIHLKNFWKFRYFSFTGKLNSGSIEELILYYLSVFFMLPLISYSVLSNDIKKNRRNIIDFLIELATVEDSISILNYRTSLQYYCKPKFSYTNKVKAESLYHPLLTEPVSNDVNWEGIYLITGSNASGKSTYVKSIAVNIILGQSINTCCAKSVVLKAGMVYTSMAIKDNLIEGDSYFIAEIKSLRRLVENIEENNFSYYFIDEILKGTNTIERIGASTSIIAYLIEKKQMSFIATHDIELTRIFDGKVKNIHFKESIRDKLVEFDYKLHEGPSRTRNAIKLLEVLGFPKKIVVDANEVVENFEEKEEWEYKNLRS